MKFRLLLITLLVGLSGGIWADSFTVSEIDIIGLQRVSLGTVRNSLPLEVGDIANNNDLSLGLKRLFATGYFKDVSVWSDPTSGLVRYDVIEQPALSEITFTGNKLIPTAGMKQVFSNAGLVEGDVFSRSKMDGLLLEVERQYAAMGHYAVDIQSALTPVPGNRVKLAITVVEGKKAKIANINITGTQAFSNEPLLAVMKLKAKRPGNPFQVFSKKTLYSSDAVRGDQERLASYYLDRGYLRYELMSTQVTLSPALDEVYITYNISEGELFHLSSFELSGDLVGDDVALLKLATVSSGSVFSRKQIIDIQKAIQERLSDLGYVFPQLRLGSDVDEAKKTIALNLFINPGQRTYVRRITIQGNVTTQDSVVRRELTQQEGALASGPKISESKRRLERVGYFKNVQIATQPIAGIPDQVDLNISVEEMKDATLTGSIGWADPGGLFVAGEYKQKNFQGSGRDVSTSLTINSYQKMLDFSYTNPYFTKDAVSLAYNLFMNETDNANISENDYATNKWGGGVSLGYPLSLNQRVSFGIDYTQTALFATNPAQEIANFIGDHGKNFSNFELSSAWRYSSLNGTFLATDGQSHNVSLNVSLPLSDLAYYKLDYRGRYYQPLLGDDYVLRFRGGLGYGDGFDNTNALPFFENFISGGVSSVRGFRYGSLGPKSTPPIASTATPAAIGGNMKLEYGVDLLFPTPIAKDKSQFRSSLFFDAGNVFTSQCLPTNVNCDVGFNPDDLRYSMGYELNWMTPIAPLRFIWAWPLNAQTGDLQQSFMFTFGYAM